MSTEYSENSLVEQPAIRLFAQIGWQTVSAMEEVFGPGGTLGRETSGRVGPRAAIARSAGMVEFRTIPEAIATEINDKSSDHAD